EHPRVPTRRVRMTQPSAMKAPAFLPQALLAAVVLLVGFVPHTPAADEPSGQPLERRFAEVVQPFMKNYCLTGHGAEQPQGKLDLGGHTSPAVVVKTHRIWDNVQERLESVAMPPAKAPRQPTPHERRAVLDWLRDLREEEARRHAGDPGRVLARRLSNA